MTPEEEDAIVRAADPVAQAEFFLRLLSLPGQDPWQWVCAICGANGAHSEQEARDQAAMEHPCSTRFPTLGWSASDSDRMVMVWSYRAGAAAEPPE